MSIWVVAGFCYCKSAAKNVSVKPTGAHVQEFLLCVYTGVELLGPRLRELSTLQDNSKLFTKVVFLLIYSSNIVYKALLNHILVNTWYCQIS